MNNDALYRFKLPPEEDVIRRNRTITTYYAQLYKSDPKLYKWAGMAAFASFHIGEKLKLWNWKQTGIKSFSDTCQSKNRSIRDDAQIIRVINNRIFSEIGSIHLAFSQLDYKTFESQLKQSKKHEIIIKAFDKLNTARQKINAGLNNEFIEKLVWEANVDILWHEQLLVVQPMFNKLTNTFASAMSFFASFDYRVNHKKTNWKLASRFIWFMLRNGLYLIKKSRCFPRVTNFEHRWYWITEDLLKKWQNAEKDYNNISDEINYLSSLEDRTLFLKKSHE